MILLLLVFSSCSSLKNNYSKIEQEEAYVQAYKICIAYGCINEGTKNGLQRILQEQNDLGLATESEILGKVESVSIVNEGKEIAKKITPIDYADYEDRRPYFSDCISYAFSKQTDSLARLAFKKSLQK